MNKTSIANREAGLERLAEVLPRAGAGYAERHQYDLGPDDRSNLSGLSPYLSPRLLTEGEVTHALLSEHTPAKAEGFLQEILWRTYWKGWLEGRPQVYSNWLRLVAEDSRRWPERQDYQKAIAGETGIDAFDGWMKELRETGFLHHQARQSFASIWIFTLKLPWSLGAALFLEHLIDGDMATNLLSWRSVAGLHSKGKHYVAKAEHIKTFTKGRFHPVGLLQESPSALSGPTEPPYQSPVSFPFSASNALGESYALLLTGDDLHPESDATESMKPSLVISLRPEEAYADFSLATPVMEFKREAMADAVARSKSHFGCDAVELTLGQDAPAALSQVMSKRGLQSLVYYEPFVGPWRDLSSALAGRDVGVKFFPLRRPWDGLLHPHAVKSYFHFKKYALPQVVRTKGRFSR